MSLVTFFPIDITYKVKDNKTITYIYAKSKDKHICLIDDKFLPYFFIKVNNNSEILTQKLNSIQSEFKIVNIKEVKKKMLGKELNLLQIFVRVPEAVSFYKKLLRNWDEIENIYEADIKFIQRYMIDNDLGMFMAKSAEINVYNEKNRAPIFKLEKYVDIDSDETYKPKILAFDIETYNIDGNIVDFNKYPILMISLYGENFKKVLISKQIHSDLPYLECLDSELEMLERFKYYLARESPDILAGYYSDGFDLPYIMARFKKYKLNFNIGYDFSLPLKDKTTLNGVKIEGILHLDVLKLVRNVLRSFLKTDSYSLDSVSEILLNEQKNNVNIENLAMAWDEEGEELISFIMYNLQDSKLVYNLSIKLFPNLEEFSKITYLQPYELIRLTISRLVEGYLMKRAKEFNLIIPNNTPNLLVQRVEGAYVHEPIPGYYKNLIVFDFRSLYPSIIVSHNIDSSTLNCDCCRDENKVPELPYWFCKNKKGFFPVVLEDLINRRMSVKNLIKHSSGVELDILNARSESLKLLANSICGYLGFQGARWYCLECVRSVTSFERYYIKSVIKQSEENGFKVIYGDTDSLFVFLQEKTKDEVIKFVDKINFEFPGILKLEFENFYLSGLFVATKESNKGAKKRYVLMDESGKFKIRGFEYVRRNVPEITKKIQYEVINKILREDDVKGALDYVKNMIKKIKDKEIPKVEFIIKTKITKPLDEYSSIGPNVIVAKQMEKEGVVVKPGMLVSYIITSGSGLLRDKAVMVRNAKDYDSDYYINNHIVPAVERIFNLFGYFKDDLTKTSNQQKLGNFL